MPLQVTSTRRFAAVRGLSVCENLRHKEKAIEMPQPGAGHTMLEKFIGDWIGDGWARFMEGSYTKK